MTSVTRYLPPRILTATREWRDLDPDFLWIPTEGNLYKDQVTGNVATRYGDDRAALRPGGIIGNVGGSDTGLVLDTGFDLTGTTPWIGIMVVHVPNPAAVQGRFVYIGDTGIGWGAGNTNYTNTGTKMIWLRETLAWHVSAANAFVEGVNILSFGRTSEGVWSYTNLTSGVGIDSVTTPLNPSAKLQILGGYAGLTGCSIHAVAIFLDALTNAQFAARRGYLAEPIAHLHRQPLEKVLSEFSTSRQRTFFGGLPSTTGYTIGTDLTLGTTFTVGTNIRIPVDGAFVPGYDFNFEPFVTGNDFVFGTSTGPITLYVTYSEVINAVESLTIPGAAESVAVAESINATDQQTLITKLFSSIVEALTSTESVSDTELLSVAQSENLSIVASVSNSISANVAQLESLSILDNAESITIFLQTLAESLSALDIQGSFHISFGSIGLILVESPENRMLVEQSDADILAESEGNVILVESNK